MAETYRVMLMSRALNDLDGIYRYIAEALQQPDTASNLVDDLERQILSLEYFPYRCPLRTVGVYAGKGYRQLFVRNYTVVFRVNEADKTVIVLTVRYSASLF